MSFSTFSMFIFQVKMINHAEGYSNFLCIEHQLQENILHHFLHHNFLWNFHEIDRPPTSTQLISVSTQLSATLSML